MNASQPRGAFLFRARGKRKERGKKGVESGIFCHTELDSASEIPK